MLELGVFEGKYLNDTQDEYPASWFKHARLSDYPEPAVNLFGVRSRLPLSTWLKNGWLVEQDPRGWFEWYCRYYNGRRSADDHRQIMRWRSFVRHSGAVIKKGDGNLSKRRVQRQALLQWAYDPLPDFKTRRGETVYDKVYRLYDRIQATIT